MSQAAASTPHAEISTLDVLKCVAVALMIVDHVGLYFVAEEPWLRVLGRPAAVIFGFLIGFSRSTRVPSSWVGLGVGLTLLNGWLFPESEDRSLDILVSLALTRILMPTLERLHAAQPLWLAPAAVGFALLIEPINAYLEYGTEVALMALLGLAVRLDQGGPAERTARDAVVLVALIGMSLTAIRHFGFMGWEAAGCTALLAVTMLVLASFERGRLAAPAWLAPLLRFCGRNTLWIYAVHLAAMMIVAWLLIDSPEEE